MQHFLNILGLLRLIFLDVWGKGKSGLETFCGFLNMAEPACNIKTYYSILDCLSTKEFQKEIYMKQQIMFVLVFKSILIKKKYHI